MNDKVIKFLIITSGLCFTSNKYAAQSATPVSDTIKSKVLSKDQLYLVNRNKDLMKAIEETIESLSDYTIEHEISDLSALEEKSRSRADKIRLSVLANERNKRIHANDWDPEDEE